MNQKDSNFNSLIKAANVAYPLLVYWVVMNIVVNIGAVIVVRTGGDYEKQYMMLQTVAAVITILFIYRYHRKDKNRPTPCHAHLAAVLQQKSTGQRIGNGIFMFAAGASAGIVLNNLIAMTVLEEVSEGYQEVTQYFYAGGILFELLGAALAIPILEELLYRSVIYGRICDILMPVSGQPLPDAEPPLPEPEQSSSNAGQSTEGQERRQKGTRMFVILFTALVFGAMHGNMVQFVYATLLGIMFACFVEAAGHMYGAVAAHIGANLFSVLRAETSLFGWMDNSRTAFYVSTVAFAVAAVILLGIIWKSNRT